MFSPDPDASIRALVEAAELENEDGSPCAIEERAEFVQQILQMIYGLRLEAAVKAGKAEQAEVAELTLRALKLANVRYEEAQAQGQSKTVASAELFKAFNAIDAAYGQVAP